MTLLAPAYSPAQILAGVKLGALHHPSLLGRRSLINAYGSVSSTVRLYPPIRLPRPWRRQVGSLHPSLHPCYFSLFLLSYVYWTLVVNRCVYLLLNEPVFSSFNASNRLNQRSQP
jgi:hypothetical protein